MAVWSYGTDIKLLLPVLGTCFCFMPVKHTYLVNGDGSFYPWTDDDSALLDADWLDQSNGCPVGQARISSSAALYWADSRMLPSGTGICPHDQQRELPVSGLHHRTPAAGICPQVPHLCVTAQKKQNKNKHILKRNSLCFCLEHFWLPKCPGFVPL